MSKHTPGPYFVTDSICRFYGGEVIRAGDAKEGSLVAVVCDFNQYDRDDERKANAALFAAAPELLVALEIAEKFVRNEAEILTCDGMRFCEHCDATSAHTTIKAAIAKAKGEVAS